MLSKLYKLIFDISICYTIGAFLLNYFGGIATNGRSFLILLISALVSTLLSRTQKLKIFAILFIPAIILIFTLPTIPELVVFMFVWAYSSYLTITEHLVINRGEFMDRLKRFLYSCLLVPFLMLAEIQNFGIAVQTACPYLITALVSAVFLLRYLRTDNQMGQMKRYKWQQFMELLVFLIICMMLTLARVPQNLAEGLKLMYQHLLGPVLSFFASIISVLISGIIYLFIAAVGLLTKNNEMEEVKINFGKTMRQTIDITEGKVASIDWLAPLMYSIVAIIGMVLLFFFFRWLMGERMKQKMPVGILETREYLGDAKDKRAAFRKKSPKDSRAAVRYYYGKCILWLLHKRVKLKPQDTTEEISNKYCHSGQVDGLAGSSSIQTDNYEAEREASAQLKQIYRKARYQMTEQITKEEAEKVKQLYQTIKNSKIEYTE